MFLVVQNIENSRLIQKILEPIYIHVQNIFEELKEKKIVK